MIYGIERGGGKTRILRFPDSAKGKIQAENWIAKNYFREIYKVDRKVPLPKKVYRAYLKEAGYLAWRTLEEFHASAIRAKGYRL
ncbi:MAG: hypothetical protein WCL08_00040 [Verrucomicrobiota bacterium]